MAKIDWLTEQDARKALEGKRRSECSQEEWDVATEHWVRTNINWEDERVRPILKSLIDIIDRLRGEGMPKQDLTLGSFIIAEERKGQLVREGFDNAQDDQYVRGELLDASSCYIQLARDSDGLREILVNQYKAGKVPNQWPHNWERYMWKPALRVSNSARINDLKKGGALVAAEIDRLIRRRQLGED